MSMKKQNDTQTTQHSHKHGDYVACSRTYWKGEYVLDDKLKIKWCKPTELIPGKNENELQILTLSFITESQLGGYSLLLVYSILMIIIVLCSIYHHVKNPNNPENEEENHEEENQQLEMAG
ncbi:hypothetical protein R3I93_017081 [Phoxinus phoxinus]|uniref:Uncharacterized protein n=1 Tax=Phoxinus phoxinus TaxID=58324 RepID=A0AAN9CIG6_9TELE